MKKLYFCILFVLCLSAKGQLWEWAVVEPHNAQYEGWGLKLAKDNAGNFLSYRLNGHYLSKYNANGSLLWTKIFPDDVEFREIKTSSQNDIYVVALFRNTITIGSVTFTSKGFQDFFLARFDGHGNLQWIDNIGSKYQDMPGGICFVNNSVLLLGQSQDTISMANQIIFSENYPDVFLAKFDCSNGSLDTIVSSSWVHNQTAAGYPDYYDGPGEISVDRNGDLVLILNPIDSLNFRSTLFGYGAYILKMDTAFTIQWATFIHNGFTQQIYDLEFDSADNIYYIYHYSWHYVDMGSIRKLSSQGNPVTFYNDHYFGHINGMAVDNTDNVLFTAQGDKWNYSGYPPDTFYFVVGKLTSNLSELWILKDSSLNYRSGEDILILDNGMYIASGTFEDTIVLHDSLIAPDPFDCFIASLNPDVSTSIPGDIYLLNSDINLFPNPNNGLFTVQITKSAEIKIYNRFGDIIYNQTIKSPNQQIDLSDQPKGVYFLEIICAGKSEQSKFVLD
jgi:hypothetical protein